MEEKEKKVKPVTVISAILAILVGYLAIIGILIYFFGMNNALTDKTAQIFPYPAAIVGGKIITVSSLEKRVAAARKFYENQDFSSLGLRVDFSTPDGKKRLLVKERQILNKMVEDAVIEAQANKKGVRVTSDMISQEVKRRMDQYGSRDEVESNINKLYGWDISDFEENIVKPDMYSEKLNENFRKSDAGFSQAKEKIIAAQKELGSGKDFESVVAKYSEGESAKNRGDLGWFGKDEMLPEIASVAFNLDKGKTSDIIESSVGYHIIRIEDKKTEDSQDKVHVRQIFVRTPSFADWLAERKNETRIYIPMKMFSWNKETDQVEFGNDDMNNFERNIENNSPGDASVMF